MGPLLRAADQAVCNGLEAGLTTLVGFCVAGSQCAGASCGDSAIFASAGGRLWEITAGQPKNPPVGSGVASFYPFQATLTAPWAVLAMSDGVWKYAGMECIAEAMRTAHGQQLIERLQESARLRGTRRFRDDFTAVLLELAA